MQRPCKTRLTVGASLAILVAAAAMIKPDAVDAAEIVVVIPGIGGSELHNNNGQRIWPPLNPLQSANVVELMRDDVKVGDILRDIRIQNWNILSQYSDLIRFLDGLGFYERENALLTCPYDWRKGNAQAAEKLANLLDDAVQRRGATKINLIAHSMGGLVARYYLEKGDFDRRPGFAKVARLITLGTPHRGAPESVRYARGDERWLWLTAEGVKTLSADGRYPSLYELFPPQGEPFAWADTPGSEYEPIDIYNLPNELGLSASNLQAASTFHKALESGPKQGVRYFAFLGSQQTTAVALLVNESQGWSVFEKRQFHSGDGRVPTWSGTISGWQSFAVGGEHGDIYRSISLRETTARILGRHYRFSEPLPRLEMTVSPKVIDPGERCQVSLSTNDSIPLAGELRVERAAIDMSANTFHFEPVNLVLPIDLRSLQVSTLDLALDLPSMPGVYRVMFFGSEGDSQALDNEMVFIREQD